MNVLLIFPPIADHSFDCSEAYATRPFFDWALQSVLQVFAGTNVQVLTSDEAVAASIEKEVTAKKYPVTLSVLPNLGEPDELESLIAAETSEQPLLLINGNYPLITPELLTGFLECFEEDVRVPLVTADESHGTSVPVAMLQGFPSLQDQGTDHVRYFSCDSTTFFSPLHIEDKTLIEFALRRFGYTPPASKKIKLIVVDSDGVLNDAGFYYDENAEVMKKFNTRDGAGIKQVQGMGVEVRIITGEKSGFTPARAKKLGIAVVETGCSSKLPVLDRWRQELGLEWNAVAYMGDDLPDLPCISAAGIGACPSNAEPELIEVADYVAPSLGGHGCVRDLIRYLIANDFL